MYSPRPPAVSPLSVAALLLTSIAHLRRLGLPHPTATEALDGLGVTRSRAYELKTRLEALLKDLVAPPGRPSKPEPEPAPAPPSLPTELLGYLTDHPGAISGGRRHRRYSDGLRLFVLDLLERHRNIALEAIAEAITIPLGTLKDWLRGGTAAVQTPTRAASVRVDPRGPQLQTLLFEWEHWTGTFTAFCEHVQIHCRLPFGRTLLASFLEGMGVRIRERRGGRSPTEQALRDAFITFFPHAQWVGDGSQVPVEVDGELFVFNLELDVDAFSGAFVGANVSRVEDSAAVIDTFRDAIETTGTRPLALLLDNKPSNHTEEVEAELDDTLLIRSTSYRPQNKAHVEGGFGLLKPSLEGLRLSGGGSRQTLAASWLSSLVIAVGRTINHRPRRDRWGCSRADLLAETPSPEEVEQARHDLAELQRRQAKARETRAARQDPVVRARLAAAYKRLGLDDPHGHLLTATAGFPLDPVVEAIAIFEARQRTGSLPDSADARYLLGIASNLHAERETWELAEALWAERVAARDELARHLDGHREAIARQRMPVEELIAAYVDRALDTRSRLERFFWLVALADVTAEEPFGEQGRLFRLAARRIAATHAISMRDRNAAIRFLAAKITPLS